MQYPTSDMISGGILEDNTRQDLENSVWEFFKKWKTAISVTEDLSGNSIVLPVFEFKIVFSTEQNNSRDNL
jgi:hypothetical protein